MNAAMRCKNTFYLLTYLLRHYSLTRQTPGDDCGFQNEVRLMSRVEDYDEHAVHVVSLDSVPEERDEDQVVAEDVCDATAKTRAGVLLSNVQYDQ